MSSTAAETAVFVSCAAASLLTSGALVVRLERIAARFGLTEAALGLLAALAADGPEISSSVTALVHHDSSVGVGIVIGSNLFNLAVLLGLSALVAAPLLLARGLALFEGIPALGLAAIAALALARVIGPVLTLVACLVVFVPYVVLAVAGPERIGRRLGGERSIGSALEVEEAELRSFVHPRPATTRDGVEAVLAIAVVIVASSFMERSAVTLGDRFDVATIVVGGLVLAAVTSIPNAVAAIYLARRRRPAALLSEASNSNAINVVCGLAIPAVLVGRGVRGPDDLLIGCCYLGLTVVAYAAVVARRGIHRSTGVAVIAGYLVFVLLALWS